MLDECLFPEGIARYGLAVLQVPLDLPLHQRLVQWTIKAIMLEEVMYAFILTISLKTDDHLLTIKLWFVYLCVFLCVCVSVCLSSHL